MNYLKKFWDGDVPLVISYWIIGVILNVIVSFSIGFILTFVLLTLGTSDTTINILLNLFIIAWIIFLTVGIWRSADKYQGKKIWSHLTKLVLVIGIIWVFVDTIVNPNII